eukprot:1151347-Pelagomonas_calceolata.AAC.1
MDARSAVNSEAGMPSGPASCCWGTGGGWCSQRRSDGGGRPPKRASREPAEHAPLDAPPTRLPPTPLILLAKVILKVHLVLLAALPFVLLNT